MKIYTKMAELSYIGTFSYELTYTLHAAVVRRAFFVMISVTVHVPSHKYLRCPPPARPLRALTYLPPLVYTSRSTIFLFQLTLFPINFPSVVIITSALLRSCCLDHTMYIVYAHWMQ